MGVCYYLPDLKGSLDGVLEQPGGDGVTCLRLAGNLQVKASLVPNYDVAYAARFSEDDIVSRYATPSDPSDTLGCAFFVDDCDEQKPNHISACIEHKPADSCIPL